MTSAERQQAISLLQQKVKLYETLSQSGTIGKDDLLKYKQSLEDLAKLQRIENSFQDIMVFAQTYFEGDSPQDLLQTDTPSPQFHFDLAKILRENALSEWGSRTALAAPRSHAKSVICSNVFASWVVCFAEDVKRMYWIILGDKQATAASQVNVVRMTFQENEKIKADFGDLVERSTTLELVFRNGLKLQAAGAGEALRGLRWGASRPSVICDDLEGMDNVSTPEQIQKMVNYFDQVVVPLGDPRRMMIVVVGTVLHYRSLLATLINERPDWKSKIYAALESYPDRMDLWDQWQKIYLSREEGDSPAQASEIAGQRALAFYKQNQEEMDKGASVLWKERMPLYDIMTMRAVNPYAFSTEMQNMPHDSTTQVFKTIHYYDPQDIDINELIILGGCDPSLAQTKRADPSAIITLGKSKVGIYYVLDIDVVKRSPDKIIEDVLRKALVYDYKWVSVEAIQFQQFFASEMRKRSAMAGVYLNIREYKSKVNKEMRIASLEPLITNGYIRFLPTQLVLLEQLMYFPKLKNDDAVDILAQTIEQDRMRGGHGVVGRL